MNIFGKKKSQKDESPIKQDIVEKGEGLSESDYILNLGFLNINPKNEFLDEKKHKFSDDYGCTYILTNSNKILYSYHDTSKNNKGQIWLFMPNNENFVNENIIQISQGTDHILALSADGTVYSWGKNSQYQCGRNHIDRENLQENEKKIEANRYEETFMPPGVIHFSETSDPESANTQWTEKIYRIYAFRNSSFAVSRNGRSYNWGSREFDEKTKESVSYIPNDLKNINKSFNFSSKLRASTFVNNGKMTTNVNGIDRVSDSLSSAMKLAQEKIEEFKNQSSNYKNQIITLENEHVINEKKKISQNLEGKEKIEEYNKKTIFQQNEINRTEKEREKTNDNIKKYEKVKIDIKEVSNNRDLSLANDSIDTPGSSFQNYLDFFSDALIEVSHFSLEGFYKYRSEKKGFVVDDFHSSQIQRICNEKIMETYNFFLTESRFFRKEMGENFYNRTFSRFENICLDNLELMKRVNNFTYIILREAQNYEEYFTLTQLKKENDMNYVDFDINPDEKFFSEKWKNLNSLKENINKNKGN